MDIFVLFTGSKSGKDCFLFFPDMYTCMYEGVYHTLNVCCVLIPTPYMSVEQFDCDVIHNFRVLFLINANSFHSILL